MRKRTQHFSLGLNGDMRDMSIFENWDSENKYIELIPICKSCNNTGLNMLKEWCTCKYGAKREERERVSKISELRKNFLNDVDNYFDVAIAIVVAVKLPSGAIEVITNYQDVETKINYYVNAYDNEFKLKSNPEVQIIGYMLV
jgi:hypothetical protein